MPRLALLSKSQQKKFDLPPHLTNQQRSSYFALDQKIEDYINSLNKNSNKIGFLLQLGYFRASGKFFPTSEFRSKDIAFVGDKLGIKDPKAVFNQRSYHSNARISHQKYIFNYTRWEPFSRKYEEKLLGELLLQAKNQIHPSELFPIASQYLITNKIELPSYSVLCDNITKAYQKVESSLIEIVDSSLTESQKETLEDLIWFDDKRSKDYKYSALARIKTISFSTNLSDILDSIKTFTLLKEFNHFFSSVYEKLELSQQASSYYSTWVQKSRLFQLKQFRERPKAYLYLLAHIRHQYYLRNDLYVDIILKLVSSAKNSMEKNVKQDEWVYSKDHRKTLERLIAYNTSEDAFLKALDILNSTELNSNQKIESTKELIISFLKNKKDHQKELLAIQNQLEQQQEERAKRIRSIALSLQKKLTPMLQALNFVPRSSDHKLMKAISSFKEHSGDSILNKEILNATEKKLIFRKQMADLLLYKSFFFIKVLEGIKAGTLNCSHSYRFLPFEDYLLSPSKWKEGRNNLLLLSKLESFSDFELVMDNLKGVLDEKYREINHDYKNKTNKYLHFSKNGHLIVTTPKAKEASKNKLSTIFMSSGIIPIEKVLNDVNFVTRFTDSFRHHANKSVKLKPSNEILYAGILSKGCNHGVTRMANISKGISEHSLKNTVNWFFTLENLQNANEKIIACVNNMALPKVYQFNQNQHHTSSDGQKINVGVDSIHANYSFKYFGKDQGVSIYSFIDERNVLFYNTVISPTEREAAYVIDGLMANHVIKSDIHSTDTHGFTEIIFAVTHLIGVSFAPRIKRVGAQKRYAFEAALQQRKKDYEIRSNAKINLKQIERHWEDILRLVATIRNRQTTASQLFKRLNSYTREHPLYKALKEFGRIIKTIFILTYFDNLKLRQQVELQLSRIELSNKFSKAVFFANGQEFRDGCLEEQKIIVACKSLIQNCIVLWNYLYLSKALLAKEELHEKEKLLNIIKKNSIICWRHINLHGEYDFIRSANDAGDAGEEEFDLTKLLKLKIA